MKTKIYLTVAILFSLNGIFTGISSEIYASENLYNSCLVVLSNYDQNTPDTLDAECDDEIGNSLESLSDGVNKNDIQVEAEGENLIKEEILSLKAECFDELIELSWISVYGFYTDFFTVYKSLDGIEFEPVAIIYGQGNSKIKAEYVFIDEPGFREKPFYKIKQTDFDGVSTWYKTIFAECDKDYVEVVLSPNPYKENLVLYLDAPLEKTGHYEIYDLLGNKICEHEIPINVMFVDVVNAQNLKSGTYFIRIIADGVTTTQQIIKM